MCGCNSIPMLAALRRIWAPVRRATASGCVRRGARPRRGIAGHHAFSDPGNPRDDRRAAEEVAAVHDGIQAGNARRDARRRIERRRVIAACSAGACTRRYTSMPCPSTIRNEWRPICRSCPRDLTISIDRTVARNLFFSQSDHGIGNRFFGQRGRAVPSSALASTASTAVRFSRCSPSTRT